MASKNGLTSASPVFYNGTQPIWAAQNGDVDFNSILVEDDAGDSVEITSTAVTVSQGGESTTVNANEVILEDAAGNQLAFAVNTPNGTITSSESVQIIPHLNASQLGLSITTTGTSPATLVLNNTNPTISQTTVKAIKPIFTLSLEDNQTDQQGADNSGTINYLTMTESGIATIQFSGSGCIPGTLFQYVLNPASASGGQIQFANGGTILDTFSPAAAAPLATHVQIFTPDGTNFLLLN